MHLANYKETTSNSTLLVPPKKITIINLSQSISTRTELQKQNNHLRGYE